MILTQKLGKHQQSSFKLPFCIIQHTDFYDNYPRLVVTDHCLAVSNKRCITAEVLATQKD